MSSALPRAPANQVSKHSMVRFMFYPARTKNLNEKALSDFLTLKTQTELNEIYYAHTSLRDESNIEIRDSLTLFVRDRRFMPFYLRSS